MGDNSARDGRGTPRASITVYRFPEASVDLTGAPVALDVTPEAITLSYPGAPHDCESLGVDSESGDLYLMTKEDSGPSILFVAVSTATPPIFSILNIRPSDPSARSPVSTGREEGDRQGA
mgnify:CR=1 FL=1